ncbi:unnamed protein product [Ectocarpus sp. CCAP 1310/34]|nr:unnamed protein product [Ectocarpus sp. CCAP 1310/34]
MLKWYNYTGEAFFVKKKDRGFRHVTSTAKQIIREALPIQCVEAVFVGAYLTADMAEAGPLFFQTLADSSTLSPYLRRFLLPGYMVGVDRFPVCFRSSLDGRVYRHIVLAVRSGGKWGSLGLSRRDTLMYKELKYELFSKLVGDFRESYASNWHRLEQVWVGFPLPHDISSNVAVKWKVLVV